MNTLLVRNLPQMAIFEHEIKEQLHTGRWKKTRPLGHWRPWCDASVTVAGPGEAVGRNVDVSRDQYDLTAKDLLQFGQTTRRMITKVKVMLTFGEHLYDRLIHLYDRDGLWIGMPTGVGENEERIRERINALLARAGEPAEVLKDVHQLVSAAGYTEKQLKSDLTDLQATMRADLRRA